MNRRGQGGLTDVEGLAATQGFTLVEMMIVLAVLAMSVLIAGPMLHRETTANDLDGLGRRIALAARSARVNAMRRNVESALVFDGAGRNFLVLPNLARIALPMDVSARLETGRELEIQGRPAIRFLPDERSSGGEIRLATRTASLHLSIDWLTGWVRREPS